MAKNKGTGKFLLGALIGAGISLLFTTKKGEEIRRELGNKFDDLLEKVGEIDAQEVKEAFDDKVAELKSLVVDMDKEKALEIAKDTADKIKEKSVELYDLAKEKGTPVLQDSVSKLRKQAIKYTKVILKKLENN